jgi:uncharacterized membrane protein
VVLVLLALAGLASVVGVVTLWPDGAEADRVVGSIEASAQGVTYPEAVVDQVQPACALSDGSDGQPPGTLLQDGTCGQLVATVAEGTDEGRQVTVQVPPEVSASGLSAGDRVELLLTPAVDGQPGQASYFSTERSTPLLLLLVAFVVVVLLVARWRGLMALVGLGFAAAVVTFFVLPALLTGEPAIPVAVTGSTAIMFVVLYTTHGFSLRTSTALLGTLAGLAASALVGAWAVGGSHLTGITDESGQIVQSYAGGIDVQGLLIAAIIVAGLGVLNDVTITQASAVWELRAASPDLSRRAAYRAGMRIGRDHIASTIYTIVFAYAGSALTVLLYLALQDRPVAELIGTEELSTEIVRSLATSIGLVLAVPLTTLIAALTVGAARPAARPGEPSEPAPGRRRAGR